MPLNVSFVAAAAAGGLGYYYLKNAHKSAARRGSVGGSPQMPNWNPETTTDPLTWQTSNARWQRDHMSSPHVHR